MWSEGEGGAGRRGLLRVGRGGGWEVRRGGGWTGVFSVFSVPLSVRPETTDNVEDIARGNRETRAPPDTKIIAWPHNYFGA